MVVSAVQVKGTISEYTYESTGQQGYSDTPAAINARMNLVCNPER